jgi:hypothetical protein
MSAATFVDQSTPLFEERTRMVRALRTGATPFNPGFEITLFRERIIRLKTQREKAQETVSIFFNSESLLPVPPPAMSRRLGWWMPIFQWLAHPLVEWNV